MHRYLPLLFLCSLILLSITGTLSAQDTIEPQTIIIQPGDTWTALSYRTGIPRDSLIDSNGTINPQLQLPIGSTELLHEKHMGTLSRSLKGGSLQSAILTHQPAWAISSLNDLEHPYSPHLYKPIFIPGGTTPPKELPYQFNDMILLKTITHPGEAIAIKGRIQEDLNPHISINETVWNTMKNGDRVVSIGATGAFYNQSIPELRIQVGDHPLWTQPFLFHEKYWFFDQVDFVASSATEREEMDKERERLRTIWSQVTPEPYWISGFVLPIEEFIEISSHYGARRSVNGGPYDTYHEGTDFSAFGGTPVTAPAAGIVVLAEPLVVRGGAVILDHGLGIHTGYYHLSEINVQAGDKVATKDLIGAVGSTGRSTGNHLHWDVLIGTTWIDGEDWLESGMAEWIRTGWGEDFPQLPTDDVPSHDD